MNDTGSDEPTADLRCSAWANKSEQTNTCNEFFRSIWNSASFPIPDVSREKDEIELTNYLATSGPIPVGIDAGPRSFQHYKSGVYYDRSCKKIRLNHSVLLVGYGSDQNGDYYIMKNSWGTDWGDNGYMKMARNRNNACGIASDATIPVP